MNRVPVKPDLLLWARERAGFSADDLARKFPHRGMDDQRALIAALLRRAFSGAMPAASHA